MEENKDYHAYRYGDHLTPGSELKIEHSVVCENVDISTLITMGTDSLEAMRQGSIDGEQKAYEIVVAAAKQWEQQAAATQTINRALEYLRTPEIEHTGNQWKDTDNWRADQKISNRVYQMTCSIWDDEWLMSAEYIMSEGNQNVILCERGIRTFEKATRNTLDLSAVTVVKRRSHLPVIVDPSHATGHRWMVEDMAMAAIAAGADGIMCEVHNDPEHAWCDGAESITPETFDHLMGRLRQLAPIVGREL